MPSPAYKHFGRVVGLSCGIGALRLFYSAHYLVGAIFLLIGIVWVASTFIRTSR